MSQPKSNGPTAGRPRPSSTGDECYQDQLAPDELRQLGTALLGGEQSIEDVRKDAPPWRTGRWAGELPGIETLTLLRDTLQFEQTAAASKAARKPLLTVLKDTALTEAQLDTIGHKLLTTLAILRLDTKTFLQLTAARSEVEFERQRLAFRDREADRDDKAHELARQKFQRDTCNLFLKWNEDSRAQEIASSSGSNADKIEALGRIMFGEEWDEPLPENTPADIAAVATPAEGIA